LRRRLAPILQLPSGLAALIAAFFDGHRVLLRRLDTQRAAQLARRLPAVLSSIDVRFTIGSGRAPVIPPRPPNTSRGRRKLPQSWLLPTIWGIRGSRFRDSVRPAARSFHAILSAQQLPALGAERDAVRQPPAAHVLWDVMAAPGEHDGYLGRDPIPVHDELDDRPLPQGLRGPDKA